jgi:hypothetical protein
VSKNKQLSRKKLDALKSRFREAECTVSNLEGGNFEITHAELPLRTHVFVNPYYVELGTIITAKSDRRHNNRSAVHAFLNRINRDAKLAKFTLDSEKQDERRGGWSIFASVKFVTGEAGGDYNAVALKNLVTLWFLDLAELMAAPEPFELYALMQAPESNDD